MWLWQSSTWEIKKFVSWVVWAGSALTCNATFRRNESQHCTDSFSQYLLSFILITLLLGVTKKSWKISKTRKLFHPLKLISWHQNKFDEYLKESFSLHLTSKDGLTRPWLYIPNKNINMTWFKTEMSIPGLSEAAHITPSSTDSAQIQVRNCQMKLQHKHFIYLLTHLNFDWVRLLQLLKLSKVFV